MRAQTYFVIFLLVVLSKMALLMILSAYGHDFFGGGNDGNYYNAYALGYVDNAVNIWPVLLRELNSIGLYSRAGITWVLMLMGWLVIPFLVARLSIIKHLQIRQRTFWFCVVVMSIYPTLLFFSLDIYRDVFMIFVFLMGLYFISSFIETKSYPHRISLIFVIGAISVLLYLLRSYLGVAFLAAFIGLGAVSSRRVPWLTYFILYLVGLNIAYAAGLLDPLIQYRSGFAETMSGGEGSTFGIQFGSAATFVPILVQSLCYQVLGLYYSGVASVIVFLMESVLFIIGLFYLIFNRRYFDLFVKYLILFFVVYATVWVVGNDNLGTAVRLRVYNYIAVLIGCMIVHQRKVHFNGR